MWIFSLLKYSFFVLSFIEENNGFYPNLESVSLQRQDAKVSDN